MTRELAELPTFTVPLTTEVHRLAQQFCKQHDRHKAKQVYLNTLAVSAVNFYLHCMGWETNWSASFSYNSLWQTMMDIADLEIPNLGKLECRPVLPEVNTVYIPPEVWSDRVGYVAIQLDSSLEEATLLGFTQTVPESGELPVTQLQSLTDLLEHLHQIRQLEQTKVRVNLSQWFQNLFEAGWHSLEALLVTQDLALMRSAAGLGKLSVKGAKLIDLGLQVGRQSLALLVAITPEPDGRVGILVQVHPTGTDYLPPNIQLALLSESETLQSVRSRTQDNYIQLKRFRGTPGECFNIQVASSHASVTENFVI